MAKPSGSIKAVWSTPQGVVPTYHALERVRERDISPHTVIIGANLARPYLDLDEPRKFWHDGVSIVAVRNKKGDPQVVTAMQQLMPETVREGLALVSKMLTPVPLKYRFKGFNVVAKTVHGEPVAVLIWKGGVYDGN